MILNSKEEMNMMFNRKKKKQETLNYNAEEFSPAVKSSICTGEKVAGFVEKKTGKFEDIMLIKTEEDLQEFKRMYDIKEEFQKIW